MKKNDEKAPIWLQLVKLLCISFFSGIGGFFGSYWTIQNEAREISRREIETVEKFVKHLAEDKTRGTAIAIIYALGRNSLAIDLVIVNPSTESIALLGKIIRHSSSFQDQQLPSLGQGKKTQVTVEHAIEAVQALKRIAESAGDGSELFEDVSTELTSIETEINSGLDLDNTIQKKIQGTLTYINELRTSPSSSTATNTNNNSQSEANSAIITGSFRRNLRAARNWNDEATATEKLKDKGITSEDMVIYDRKGHYRTAILVDNNKEPTIVETVKKEFNPSSYLVDVSLWCQDGEKSRDSEIINCKNK